MNNQVLLMTGLLTLPFAGMHAQERKDKKASQKYMYGAYIDLQRMIRSDRFKLIMYPKINKVRLYDLQNDPREMHDLASNPQYKKTADLLFKEFKKLQKETGDEMDLTPCYEGFFKE